VQTIESEINEGGLPNNSFNNTTHFLSEEDEEESAY